MGQACPNTIPVATETQGAHCTCTQKFCFSRKAASNQQVPQMRANTIPSHQSEVFKADLLSVTLLSLGKVVALSYPEETEHEGHSWRELGHSHCSGTSGWGLMELCLLELFCLPVDCRARC